MRKINLVLFLILGSLLASCKGGPKLMPSISGKAGEVIVVISKGDWESDPGIALRSVLGSEHPYLPQIEPLFNLVNVPENAFSNIFQTHRNIIIVHTAINVQKPTIAYQENVWAAPQTVVTISTANAKDAAELVTKESDKLTNVFLQAERNRNISNAKKYEEKALRDVVTATFGGSPYFPKGYTLKKNTADFIWISYETTYTNLGVFVYSYPFKDSTDFTPAKLLAMRNDVLFRNVPGEMENSYMTTNMSIDPGFRWVKYNKRSFVELRSLWEVQNDFMGGPFVDHVFLDKEKKKLIVLEAFVYAPRYDKRNYLRQVESIIYSFEFF